jgi:hypothetical protein
MPVSTPAASNNTMVVTSGTGAIFVASPPAPPPVPQRDLLARGSRVRERPVVGGGGLS